MGIESEWEARYAEGNTPWDRGEPAPPLLEQLARHGVPEGRILVPGCGLGHDVRALAAAAPEAEIVGLDISPTAVKRALALPRVGRETYVEGDLFALPEDWRGGFDALWEHTCFCAIDPSWRDAYARAVAEAIKPGGLFFGVFYLNPYDEEHPPGAGPPWGVTGRELDERFAADFDLEERWVPATAYPGREGREECRRSRRK